MPDWRSVLDDLETRLTGGDAPPWSPPPGLGPLPADLRPRAEDLLRRQREVLAAGRQELARIGAGISDSRRAPARYTAEPAVYIDTVA